MSVALHGNLRDFGIGEVFQLIGQQQKTGFLEVEGQDERIRVAFDRGAVVWAETTGPYDQAAVGDRLVRAGLLTPERLTYFESDLAGSDDNLGDTLVREGAISAEALNSVITLVTRDTIFGLLRWRAGSFHFTSKPVIHRRDASDLLPAEQILMDGLRMVDEWQMLDPSATRDETVYRRTGSFDLYRAAHRDERPERLAVAERLFLLIDGRLPNRRIVDLSRLGTFEAASVLSGLLRLGALEVVEQAQLTRRRRPVPGALRAAGLSGLASALAVVPFVALVLVAWLAARPLVAPPAPLGGDPVAQADHAYEVVRARQLALAYRYAQGRWPAGLGDLEALEAPRLAVPPGGSYYFRQHGDGVVVLAPQPTLEPEPGER